MQDGSFYEKLLSCSQRGQILGGSTCGSTADTS